MLSLFLGDVQIPLPRGNNRYLHLVGDDGDDGDIPVRRLEPCIVVCLGKGCDCLYTSKCDGPCNNCITCDCITCDCDMMWEHELVVFCIVQMHLLLVSGKLRGQKKIPFPYL